MHALTSTAGAGWRHAVGPLALVLTVVLVLIAAIAPGASAGALQVAGPRGDRGGVQPAYQVQGCFADALGDTTQGIDGPRAASPQNDLDQFCIDHTPAALGVSVRAPQGTDPASDPVWNDFGAAIAFVYLTASGQEREIQLSTQRADGTFEYLVLEGTISPTLVCSGPAAFSGGTYSAAIPADCVAAPDTIEVQTSFGYDARNGQANQFVDFAPGDGGIVAVPRTAPAGADRVTRVAGPGRVDTAIQASRASFGDGQAGAVLIADDNNFPDALVAAPLAVARQAPVLLTPTEAVGDAVRQEVLRALGGPGDVILLGGTAALSDAVRQALAADGHTVSRVAGDGRVATSIAVATAADPSPDTILLAGGGDFPDALLAGATAPSTGGVAVLVDDSGISPQVQQYLDRNPDARLLGVGRVAEAVAGGAYDSVAGFNPSQTSAALLDLFPPGGEVGIASVENFPDGLSGGAYAALRGIPMLLSPRDAMESSLLEALEANGPYAQITLFGGVAALSDTVAGQAAAFQQ